VGFEPTDPFGSPVFKTGAINHSTIPPGGNANPAAAGPSTGAGASAAHYVIESMSRKDQASFFSGRDRFSKPTCLGGRDGANLAVASACLASAGKRDPTKGNEHEMKFAMNPVPSRLLNVPIRAWSQRGSAARPRKLLYASGAEPPGVWTDKPRRLPSTSACT
jgi:hypothetical protein